jgi:hypothetical protein
MMHQSSGARDNYEVRAHCPSRQLAHTPCRSTAPAPTRPETSVEDRVHFLPIWCAGLPLQHESRLGAQRIETKPLVGCQYASQLGVNRIRYSPKSLAEFNQYFP